MTQLLDFLRVDSSIHPSLECVRQLVGMGDQGPMISVDGVNGHPMILERLTGKYAEAQVRTADEVFLCGREEERGGDWRQGACR